MPNPIVRPSTDATFLVAQEEAQKAMKAINADPDALRTLDQGLRTGDVVGLAKLLADHGVAGATPETVEAVPMEPAAAGGIHGGGEAHPDWSVTIGGRLDVSYPPLRFKVRATAKGKL